MRAEDEIGLTRRLETLVAKRVLWTDFTLRFGQRERPVGEVLEFARHDGCGGAADAAVADGEFLLPVPGRVAAEHGEEDYPEGTLCVEPPRGFLLRAARNGGGDTAGGALGVELQLLLRGELLARLDGVVVEVYGVIGWGGGELECSAGGRGDAVVGSGLRDIGAAARRGAGLALRRRLVERLPPSLAAGAAGGGDGGGAALEGVVVAECCALAGVVVIEVLGFDDWCFALAGFSHSATDGVGLAAVFCCCAGVLRAGDARGLFDGGPRAGSCAGLGVGCVFSYSS